MKRIIATVLLIATCFASQAQAVITRDSLKTVFVTGAKPTQAHFHSWINSYYNKLESVNVDFGRGLYMLNSGNTTAEQDGNFRFSFESAGKAGLYTRESGTWYPMLRMPTFTGITGRLLSTENSTVGTVGHVFKNLDTTGQVGIFTIMPTASQDTVALLQYRNRVELTTSGLPLLINGVTWPPSGGGSSLWTDLGGGSIGFSSVNTRVGINLPSSPSYKLHVRGDDNLFGTIQAAFIGSSGVDGFSIRNDGSVVLSGDQTNIIFDETITTGSGAAIQYKRGGNTIGQISIDDNNLVLSTLSGGDYDGRIELNADTVRVVDGAFMVRSSSGGGVNIFQASDELGKVFTRSPFPNADFTVTKISSTSTDAVPFYINSNIPGSIYQPSVDFFGAFISTDSVSPNPDRDVVGLAIVQDTLSGLPRGSSNPEATFPLRVYRGGNEVGGYLRVQTTEGDVDIVEPIYGGWFLGSTTPTTTVGTMSVSSAAQSEFVNPAIDTSLFNTYTLTSTDELLIRNDTIRYRKATSYDARWDRNFEVTLVLSVHNTTATNALFAYGVSLNGGSITSGRLYQTATCSNSKGVMNLTYKGQIRMSPGDYIIPKITNNQASAQSLAVYQVSMSIRSID